MAGNTSSSSVGQVPKSTFKIDPCSPLWRHVDMLEQLRGGGAYLWCCRECNNKYSSSYTRLKAHLCAIPGQGIKACGGRNGKGLTAEQIMAFIREQEDADARLGMKQKHPLRKGISKPQSYVPQSPVVAASHPFMAPPSFNDKQATPSSQKRSRNDGPLEKSFQNESREIADQLVGRCIFANGLPFNVLRSPYWREMIRGVNEAPSGYCGPGYEKVRTTILEKERKYIDDNLQPIRSSWIETGVSIVSDGWKDAANRPLINVIAVCPKGAMFLRAVDCEGQVKDAEFIANILCEAIEAVGSANVVQVITDNAKNCKGAGQLVEQRYAHIFWTPCAVHSLNLILQKLGRRIEWIKTIYAEASDIQMFITNHHMSQAIFRSFSDLELLKVAETRFASNTIVLRRLVKVREALGRMVISNNWSVWKLSNTEKAVKIKALILDDEWWNLVEYLLSFTEPILSMIRFVDTDQPCIGEIYDGIDSMIEKIKGIINAKENDPEEVFFKQVQLYIMDRWNKMTTPLHLLAFALTPKYYSAEILSLPRRVPPYRDPEVSAGYKAAFHKMFHDPELEEMILSEFGNFITSTDHSLSAL